LTLFKHFPFFAFAFSLLLETLCEWMENCAPGNLLVHGTLNAIGRMKQFIAGIYPLIETAIVQYLRTSEESYEWHQPSWAKLIKNLEMSLNKLELMPIMQGPFLFTLHLFVLYKTEKIGTIGEKITFLQDQSQLVENLKTG